MASLLFVTSAAITLTTGNSQTPFAIQSIEPTNDAGYTIRWTTPPGLPNQVRYTDALDQPWRDLWGAGFLPAVNDTNFSFTDLTATNTAQRFYRIRAKRNHVVLSLVLDRSGSMMGNGGAVYLAPAVGAFIDHFDEVTDWASMNSFSYHARTDVPMERFFKTAIKNAANAMVFSGWTVSEQGLEKGRQQNESVVLPPDQPALKVIVFFTDGLANTWQYNFNCGLRNISPGHDLWDPNTGASANSGCVVPSTIPSIDGQTVVNTFNDCALYDEAEKRALYVANLARSQGNIIYAISLGDPNGPTECGKPPINVPFLQAVANDPSSQSFDPNQPTGMAIFAYDVNQMLPSLEQIAADILSRSP